MQRFRWKKYLTAGVRRSSNGTRRRIGRIKRTMMARGAAGRKKRALKRLVRFGELRNIGANVSPACGALEGGHTTFIVINKDPGASKLFTHCRTCEQIHTS